VVRELVTRLGARVSIDTVRAEVARACLEAGASIVNDVSCGQSAALLKVAALGGAELVLMHTRGDGEAAPPHTDYRDLLAEVRDELSSAAQRAQLQGVARERLWIDPGLGFAKTAPQSLELLAGLQALVATGLPVLVGASRKGYIGQSALDPNGAVPGPTERAGGTAAAVTAAVLAGAAAVRVHDVALMRQAVLVARAIRQRTTTAGAAA
jgi:dihydropteroate synthase